MKEKLLKRTFDFATRSIDLANKLIKNCVNQVIRKQFLRATTSIGANYREACEAESKKDFVHKLGICRKESRESLYWLGLILHQNKRFRREINQLTEEATGFIKIFASAVKTSKEKLLNHKF